MVLRLHTMKISVFRVRDAYNKKTKTTLFTKFAPPGHQQNDKQYVNKVNVNKVNVQVNVNKVNVKVNVNKVNDKVNDIYSIHSHYKGNHRRGAAAVRPRQLFCGGDQRPQPL